MIDHTRLTYTEEYFRDTEQLQRWKRCGHEIKNTTIHISPVKDQLLIDEIAKDYPHLSNIAVCFHCLLPGHYLPMHTDRYGYYAKKHNVTDLNQIERTVVFLEDWQPGHFLIVGDVTYANWKAGDATYWVGTEPHSAINTGFCKRYTMQVTGIYA